jgi:4-amino-4-deoxy-L-arabinose transferase-like glycosyltransferase
MSHAPLRLREHVLLSLAFVATRAALVQAGIEFDFSLDWMWLSDPADLRDRLLETLYYFHALPPGMNLMTGILLKLGGSHAATLALATFWALGLVIVNSLFHVSRVSGLSIRAAFAVAVTFSLIPQSIYFENLFLYECPITALLCLAAAFFYHGVRGPSLAWLGFFGACSAIGLTRSTFHLVWFVAMIGLGLCFTERPARRRMLGAACAPALVLLALYVKNFALFGTFDAFTFGPVNLTLVTTGRLPSEVRDTWIEEGKLSPFAAVSVDAGPREYLPFFATSERGEWPHQLNLLERPSVNAANYNHWFFLEVNRRRQADAFYYVRTRPMDYIATVLEGLGDIFTPSTEWHPLDKTDASPHHQHRQVLGRYEAFYNRFVHGFPVAPIGLYAFLPLVGVWTFRRAWSLTRTGDTDSTARSALLFFCLFQIAFVVAASSLFSSRESPRYRYQIEPMIWLTTALSLASLWQWVGGRVAARRSRH